jgi:hypothetical protein
MQIRDKFIICGSLVLLLVFSLCLVSPHAATAQNIGNATVAEKLLDGKTVKLVVFSRTERLEAPPVSMPAGDVQCHEDEIVTGGGFKLADHSHSTIVSSNKVANGWAISFVNDGDLPASATIFAQCAHMELSP